MEKYYLAFLYAVKGLSSSKADALISHFGSAKDVYEKIITQSLQDLEFINQKDLKAIFEYKEKFGPQKIKDYCILNNVKIIQYNDENYPNLLKNIKNPPKVLYVKGIIQDTDCSLGVVGSRAASAYGLKVAEFFCEDLARKGVQIVSGGAIGIDSAAHKGALNGNGNTVVVLGSGIDVIYPKKNKKLFEEIVNNGGAIITEFPIGMQPIASNFPRRNRIISGLSKGILLVEAGKKSGSLITVNYAIEQGREVYCVPGSVFQSSSIACHSLIRDGAILVDRPEIILQDFGYFDKVKKRSYKKVDISSLMQSVLECIPLDQTVNLEEVVEKSELELSKVSEILLELQFLKLIKEYSGKRYIKLREEI